MTAFLVSARKYRPQRFEDVVGQEHISATLKNALRTAHLAHAFLFCGPRGVGKTTCARILAKLINCSQKTDQFEPCGTCDSCTSFDSNASFNIIELDAASNNSVEHIRSLVEQVRIPPQAGLYKVFIIDEVHMLSQAAFNAFLKTLEEPPAYAVFILATTEKHKILPTILSRCQTYDFRRIPVPEIAGHLRRLSVLEQIAAEEAALHVIAQKADGALRDALSLFDRLVSAGQGRLSYQDVITQLNILDYDVYLRITDALLIEDLPVVLRIFNDVLYKGFEPDTFLFGLAEHFRNLLVCKDEATLQLLEYTDELRDKYQEQAFMASASFLVAALDLLNECDVQYRTARNKRLHLEIALIKLTYIRRAAIAELPVAGASEKKKPDDQPARLVPPIPENKTPSPVATDLPVTTSPPLDSIAQAESPAPGKPEPLPETATGKKEKLKLLPALKKNDEWASEVHRETAHSNREEMLLDQASLESAWQTYSDAAGSRSLQTVLGGAAPRIDGMHLRVRVGTQLARNMILQETGLIEHLRKSLHAPSLSMEIETDPSLAPEEDTTARPVSGREKYAYFREQNPLVDRLIEELKLKAEE